MLVLEAARVYNECPDKKSQKRGECLTCPIGTGKVQTVCNGKRGLRYWKRRVNLEEEKREFGGRHLSGEESAERIDQAQKTYRETQKGKEAFERYNKTESRRVSASRYSQTTKGKLTRKRFFHSPKGQASAAESYEKEKEFKKIAAWLKINPGKTVKNYLELGEG